jgi:FAD/FMN-containing dehydrogenase
MCIKQALDPLNIMNPGKVFPDTTAVAKATE